MKTEAQNNDIILQAHGIVNRFDEQIVHDGAEIEVKRGEIVGIVGGSGAGKTVFLRTLIGLNKPLKGDVEINGKPIGKITPAESAATFGVLFQQGALFSSLTVAENIMVSLKEHTKLCHHEQEQLAAMKLSLVGLAPDDGKKHPSELSGGMIKRAALARALAMDPQILFLDEPTAGLDPVAAAAFDDLISKLNESLGVTVVMVTHDLDTLFTICNRVAVLVDKKITIDTLPNLLKSKHPWIQEYFHGPRARGAREAAEISEKKQTKPSGTKLGNQ